MKILALDLGKFNTMCCVFDSKTRKHIFINASTPIETTSRPSSNNTRARSTLLSWKLADLRAGSWTFGLHQRFGNEFRNQNLCLFYE